MKILRINFNITRDDDYNGPYEMWYIPLALDGQTYVIEIFRNHI